MLRGFAPEKRGLTRDTGGNWQKLSVSLDRFWYAHISLAMVNSETLKSGRDSSSSWLGPKAQLQNEKTAQPFLRMLIQLDMPEQPRNDILQQTQSLIDRCRELLAERQQIIQDTQQQAILPSMQPTLD